MAKTGNRNTCAAARRPPSKGVSSVTCQRQTLRRYFCAVQGTHPGLHHRDRDQELLLRTSTRLPKIPILKAQLQGRLRLSGAERVTLGEIGHRLARCWR
jgi:hypothetical protein